MLNALQRGTEGEQRIADWLTKHPDDLGLRAMLAENLIKRRQYKAAAGHYLTLNKQKPGSLLVLNNLAYTLFESGDRRAAGYAAEALKLQPDNPAVLDTYGWILIHSGQIQQGLSQLRKARTQAPGDADIHYHLAVALAKAGEKSQARGELKRLLDSGVGFSYALEARKLFDSLADAR
jgi:Flp pilus assembly protein TadD